jgi:hypothetical protein
VPEKCHGMGGEKGSCSVLIEIHPLRFPAQGEGETKIQNDARK